MLSRIISERSLRVGLEPSAEFLEDRLAIERAELAIPLLRDFGYHQLDSL